MNSTRDQWKRSFHYPQGIVGLSHFGTHGPLAHPDWPFWGFLLRSATTPIGACLSDDPGAAVCGNQLQRSAITLYSVTRAKWVLGKAKL